MRETPILSLRAARRFSGVANPCTTRGAQLAFGKNHIVSPQTLRGRAKRSPRAAAARQRQGRAGCQRPNIERMVRPIRFERFD